MLQRKDPDEVLDYAIDWTAELADKNDTAQSAAWTVPDGLTQPAGKPPTLDGGKATVWLAGGTSGRTYSVSCRLTTTAGRIYDRSLVITVANR